MIIYSTGQVSTFLLSLGAIHFNIMNRATTPQTVRLLVWNTTVSPKTSLFDQTITIPALRGDEATFTIVGLVPSAFEAVVQTNDPNVVPHITGVNALGTAITFEYEYGDFFRTIGTGTVV